MLKRLRETVRRDPYPILFSAIAIGLGIGPGGLRFLRTFELSKYDPGTAVLTATLVALIWAADYSYHAVLDARAREDREEERRERGKMSILAGVVAEFSALDVWLAGVSENLYHVRLHIDRPMISEVLRNAQLFEGEAVGAIANISTNLHVIDTVVANLAADLSARPDHLLLSPAQIAEIAPVPVARLRKNIASMRESLRDAARVLHPDMYSETRWPELNSGGPGET